jgi:hypothetical protein
MCLKYPFLVVVVTFESLTISFVIMNAIEEGMRVVLSRYLVLNFQLIKMVVV